MESYLLGYGFALVIALLSWSDKIKDLQKETREMEEAFAKEKGSSYKKVQIILRQKSKVNLDKRIESLLSVIKESDTVDNITKTIELINKFPEVIKMAVKLENYLQIKFRLIIYLSFYLILSGLGAIFIPNTNTMYFFNFEILEEFKFIFIAIAYLLFLLFYLIFLNHEEILYRKKLTEMMESF